MKRSVKRHAVTQPDDSSYCLIPLTQNKNAIVDVTDYEWLMQWNWCAKWNATAQTFYAVRRETGNTKTIYMHRVIVNVGDEDVDHWNHDGLNNRRFNLRQCSQTQNSGNIKIHRSNNTSGYKGVFRDKKWGMWIAQIRINRRLTYLGGFESAEDAARAYDNAARQHFGEFASLNFP